MELLVHETAEQAAEAAATRIADLVSSETRPLSFGMAGGSAAEITYQALRGRASGWDRVQAWLSDERWVPPGHDRSNGRMVGASLLDYVGADFARPLWSENLNPEDSAVHYEARIRSILGSDRPDLIILGMGADGHTASLFPGTSALEERGRWYVANDVPQLGETRLTATYPLLWMAKLVLVVAFGAEKAEALANAFSGSNPAGLLAQGEGSVEWYVDRAAAHPQG